jgi:hypothetical protein
LPGERVTRLRNMALLIVGLRSSGAIHMALILQTGIVQLRKRS